MTAVFVIVGLAALLALLILLGGLLRVPGFRPRLHGPGSAALPEPAPLYVVDPAREAVPVDLDALEV